MVIVRENRYKLLGVTVDAVTRSELYALMAEAVSANERRVIANHNLHSIYLRHHDDRFHEIYKRAHCTYIDGIPIIFLARILGLPLSRKHRTTFLDSFEHFVAEVARSGWRLFYLGSKPGVAARGAELLRNRFPVLEIATQHGYFDATPGSAESRKVINTINAFRPNVLMVGMGMPRQEHWVIDHLEELSANAIVTSGATMDYLVGETARPPRWAGSLGLYGLVRLVNDPARLWKRYLIEPWFVLALLLRDLWHFRREAQRKSALPPKSVEEQQEAQGS